MLSPKKVKYRKMQKGRMRGKALKGGTLVFGGFGLQSTECGYLTAQQLEAARIAVNRYIRRGGKMWIRVFPDKPVCKKPAETRMGKGKGAPEGWVAVIKPGRILYELEGLDEQVAIEAFRLASYKLSFSTKFVRRGEGA